MPPILFRISKLKIVPVIAMDDAEQAGPLADALHAGGLPIAEITFRTKAAEASIKAMARRGDMLVGAGTVLDIDTAKKAADAGAAFIVSPGFNPKVVGWCVEHQMPILPGAVTPTEIEMALDHGLDTVKFFPADAFGGAKTIKALSAPYAMMNFVPTGGVNAANLADYLKIKSVRACGGSWMVTRELLAAANFAEIRKLTSEAVAIAQTALA